METTNVTWPVLYTILAALIGISTLLTSAILIPKVLNRLTPHINEEKEIASGNKAVAEYHGRIVSAFIIGMSIVIAAAIIAGLH